MLATKPIQGFDLAHQLSRLRYAKMISDGEAELIFRSISESVHTYEQVTEVRHRRRPAYNPQADQTYALAAVNAASAFARSPAPQLWPLPPAGGRARGRGGPLQRAPRPSGKLYRFLTWVGVHLDIDDRVIGCRRSACNSCRGSTTSNDTRTSGRRTRASSARKIPMLYRYPSPR